MSSSRTDFDISAQQLLLAAGTRLRMFGVALGLLWSLLFIVVALRYELQLYGDGSLFSYAIAVQEAWGFHWHNISGRVTVYLLAHAPAQAYVALTGHVHGALVLYGLLFFSAPLIGLAGTYAADETPRRTFFTFACVSTALLLPLVFGFPTEMWVAHALFWPTLAYCHRGRLGWKPLSVSALLFVALALTHGGGGLFVIAILVTLALRGLRDAAFRQAQLAFALALVPFLGVRLAFRPDAYIADALAGAAFNFITLSNLDTSATRTIAVALVLYAALYAAARKLSLANCHLLAAASVAIALVAYWTTLDNSVVAEMRYPLRTAILIATPVLGGIAAAYALHEGSGIRLHIPYLVPLLGALRRGLHPHFLAGALMLVALVHAVETAKFTVGWTNYKVALRALALGTTDGASTDDPRFVSDQSLGEQRNQFSWGSTTHFLSVLLAPGFKPARLVVNPDTNYFWLSCATATANERAPHRAIPAESRRLVRIHACMHR